MRGFFFALCQIVNIKGITVSNFVVLAFGRIFDELNLFRTK
jgi:hypothetical protein